MSRREDFDLRALLREALQDEPSKDLSEGVMSRLAAVKTAIELSRLVGVAPSNWAEGSEPTKNDDENGDDEE